MSAFAEFFLIAAIIYLWESLLWQPMRGVVLRRRIFGKKWHAVTPGQWFATRESGVVVMIPILPDYNLALCQPPPLRVDEHDRISIEVTGSEPLERDISGWDGILTEPHWLVIGRDKIRISSPRAVEGLWRAKRQGKSPAEAVRKLWQTSLSPTRATREWRRWKLVSTPIFPASLSLVVGFFFLLPFVYLKSGIIPALVVLLGLWLLMILIACRLWWIGGRVYPEVKSSFRTDALLSLLIPFHAMRAMEIASAHAMAATHPAALVIGTGDVENPWLGKFIRQLLHPRPGAPADAALASTLRPPLAKALSRFGRTLEDYEAIPSTEGDPNAVSYCPRCQSLFGPGATTCTDCREVPLKGFR